MKTLIEEVKAVYVREAYDFYFNPNFKHANLALLFKLYANFMKSQRGALPLAKNSYQINVFKETAKILEKAAKAFTKHPAVGNDQPHKFVKVNVEAFLKSTNIPSMIKEFKSVSTWLKKNGRGDSAFNETAIHMLNASKKLAEFSQDTEFRAAETIL